MRNIIGFFIPLPMKNKETGKIGLVSTIAINGIPLGTIIIVIAVLVNLIMD